MTFGFNNSLKKAGCGQNKCVICRYTKTYNFSELLDAVSEWKANVAVLQRSVL